MIKEPVGTRQTQEQGKMKRTVRKGKTGSKKEQGRITNSLLRDAFLDSSYIKLTGLERLHDMLLRILWTVF